MTRPQSPKTTKAQPPKTAPAPASPGVAAPGSSGLLPAPAAGPDPTPLPPAQAFARYRAEAEAVPLDKVRPCRADLAIVRHNVAIAVETVRPHVDRLLKELPALPIRWALEAHEVALGLMFAADQIGLPPATRAEIAEKLRSLQYWREPMLMIAEALAMLGLLPPERVRLIRAGKGTIDAARDGIALEALYVDHDAVIGGKHPFTRANLAEVAATGHWLLLNVTPDGGRPLAQPEITESSLLRDRFWYLVSERHAVLRKAGMYLLGDEDLDACVPPLQSRMPTRRGGAPSGDDTGGADDGGTDDGAGDTGDGDAGGGSGGMGGTG